MNTKQVSISLEDISLSFKPSKVEADSAWDRFGAVVNATYSNNSKVVKMKKTYGFNEAIGRAFEVNVLEFAR